jgi:hypothetical protein
LEINVPDSSSLVIYYVCPNLLKPAWLCLLVRRPTRAFYFSRHYYLRHKANSFLEINVPNSSSFVIYYVCPNLLKTAWLCLLVGRPTRAFYTSRHYYLRHKANSFLEINVPDSSSLVIYYVCPNLLKTAWLCLLVGRPTRAFYFSSNISNNHSTAPAECKRCVDSSVMAVTSAALERIAFS